MIYLLFVYTNVACIDQQDLAKSAFDLAETGKKRK